MKNVNLLDICDVYQPQTIATKYFVSDGQYTVYGANGAIGKYNKYNHEDSEVLMGCRGACGVINISKPFSWINGNAMVIKPKKDEVLHKDYLSYCLQAIDISKVITGTAQPQITRNNLKKLQIPVTNIKEQELIVAKIEELFSELDNAVETMNATKTQLEVYRQAVLSDMLCKNTTNSTLEECLISLQNGIAKRSGIYGTPVKVLRLSNITNDSVIADSEMRSINLTTTEQQKYLLDEEDGIFVRVNGSTNRVGRLILINKDKEYAYCDHLIRCKFDTGVVIPKFIKLCLDTQHSRNYMMNNLVSSAGQNTISQTTIRNLPLWIPDLIDQEQIIYEIESRLSVYESIEKTIINTLQQATAMRQSILKQAFEGRLL